MKKWHWILVALFVIVLPIGLNWAVLCNTPSWAVFNKGVAGGDEAPTIWISFWVTYISAIASFAMVFFTWRTLRQNKEQINELKRKHDNDNLGILIYSLINYRKSIDTLRLQNLLDQLSTKDYVRISKETQEMVNKFEDESFVLNIYINRVKSTHELNEFNVLYNMMYHEYGSVMCDIMRFCDFLKDMPKVDMAQYVKKELSIFAPSINERNDLKNYIQLYFVDEEDINEAIRKTAVSLMENNKTAECKTELNKRIEILISAQQNIIDNII